MTIKSLEQMEDIVKANSQLSWDGWDVLHRIPVKNAITRQDGVFIKGRWFLQSRYVVGYDGWTIPSKLVR